MTAGGSERDKRDEPHGSTAVPAQERLGRDRQFLGTDVVILGMVVIASLWLVLDSLILRPLEERTVIRWGTVRG